MRTGARMAKGHASFGLGEKREMAYTWARACHSAHVHSSTWTLAVLCIFRYYLAATL